MKSEDCNPDKVISTIQHLLKNAKDANEFYPKSLTVSVHKKDDTLLGRVNGGWSDIRDHNLCLNFTQSQAEQNFEPIKFIST